MKIIAIANQKGGVGKTTTTLNLAAALVKRGCNVLCIDLDPQSNLSSCLGYEPDGRPTISELMLAKAAPTLISAAETMVGCIRRNKEGIDYLPSSLLLASADVYLAGAMMRERILAQVLESYPLEEVYDYVLIDCLPALGVLLTNALAVADGVVIPCQAQKLAVDGLGQLLSVVQQSQRSLNPGLKVYGILLTMTDNTSMAAAVADTLREYYGDKLFGATISRGVAATDSTNDQISLVATANRAGRKGRLGREYIAFTHEFLARVEEG